MADRSWGVPIGTAAVLRLLLVVVLLGGPVGVQAGVMFCQPVGQAACHEPPPPCHGAEAAVAPASDAGAPTGGAAFGESCGAACSPVAVAHADPTAAAAAAGAPPARAAVPLAPLSPVTDKPPPRTAA